MQAEAVLTLHRRVDADVEVHVPVVVVVERL